MTFLSIWVITVNCDWHPTDPVTDVTSPHHQVWLNKRTGSDSVLDKRAKHVSCKRRNLSCFNCADSLSVLQQLTMGTAGKSEKNIEAIGRFVMRVSHLISPALTALILRRCYRAKTMWTNLSWRCLVTPNVFEIKWPLNSLFRSLYRKRLSMF